MLSHYIITRTDDLNFTMSTGTLVFNTLAEIDLPAQSDLESRLRDAGFLGEPYREKESRFLVGERFMQLVSFVGCSPYLQLEPAEEGGDNFCHIRFIGPFEPPRLFTGDNTRPPRCPHCRKPIPEWQTVVPESLEPGNEWEAPCPLCGRGLATQELDWRHNAGAGRFFIQVSEIFPGEALPVSGLFDILNREGMSWDYFYLQ